MSDTVYFLQLPGAQLQSIEQVNGQVTLHFSQVHLVQEMEGAFEDSLWTQAVDLVIEECEPQGALPDCPCEIEGGDLGDNIYVYRNHAPLPLDWQGEVSCTLHPAGAKNQVSIRGTRMRVDQIGHPRYLRHTSKQ